MLQMTSMELQDLIEQEMVANPILEEVQSGDELNEISADILDQNSSGADDGFLALEAPPVLGIGKERMHTIGEADWLPINSSCTFAFTHLTSAFRDGILPKIRVVSGIQIEPGNMGVLIDSWLGFFIQFIKDPIHTNARVIRPGHGHHQGAIHTHDAGTVLLPDG